jgi:hypothetical protein
MFKIHDFQSEKHISTKGAQMCSKNEYYKFKLPFFFYSLILWFFPKFAKEWCPFVHPRVLNALSLLKHHQFVSNFKTWNFASNGTNFKKLCCDLDYCVSIMIFSKI